MEVREAVLPRQAEESPRSTTGVTPRAILISLILIPANAYWLALTETVWYAGFPTTISLFYNVVFILLAVTLLNAAVRAMAPRKALTHAELLTVYVVLCLTSTMVSHDMLQVLTPIMTYVYEYARPENDWANLFHQYVPRWLTVDGRIPQWLGGGSSTDPVRLMYEGGSSLYAPSIWRAWVVPAGMWTIFCSALYMATLALNTIYRRRWIESERLTFPIIQLPFELTRPRAGVLREKGFWIAFGVVFGIGLLNGLKVYYPMVPAIPVTARAAPVFDIGSKVTDWPWNVAASGVFLGFYPFALGLCLLLPVELAFSCWFFYFVFRGMSLLCAIWGILRWGWGPPYIEEQSFAAYVGLAVFASWSSRGHLRAVLRTALGKGDLDDSREPMRYRTALILLTVGFVTVVGFGIAAGMSWGYAIPFFLIYLILSLAVCRIRAEMGLPAHDLHHAGPGVMLERIIGTINLSKPTATATELFSWFNRAYRAHPAPHQIEGFKLSERTRTDPRPLAWVMGFAIPLGAIAAFWALLDCMYRDGVAARFMEPKVPLIFGREPWERLNATLNNPELRRPGHTYAIGVGLVATLTMMTLTVKVPWWPFHPAGYAVSSSWAMMYLWCPMLIAWTVKSLVTRYGGNKAFRGLVPIAFGLILGDMAGGCLWSIVGLFKKGVAPYCIWGK